MGMLGLCGEPYFGRGNPGVMEEQEAFQRAVQGHGAGRDRNFNCCPGEKILPGSAKAVGRAVWH